ncbi:MAG TPA: hypothetical protein VGE21_13360 [Flavobacteriales bacterium]
MKTSNMPLWAGAVALAFLASCSSTPEDQRETMNDKMENVQDKMEDVAAADTRQEWVEEKNEVVKELRDLQTNIENKLAKTEEKLAAKDLKAKERAEHEAMLVELKKEKAIVADHLSAVEAGTAANWSTVKSDARRSMDDIKVWWDKQKDNVDAKTDADKDGDGK